MRAAGHGHDGTATQVACHRPRIHGRRHDDNPQVGAGEPRLARERDADVGVDAALVELVQDDGGEAGKQRVGLGPRGQDALGREQTRVAGRSCRSNRTCQPTSRPSVQPCSSAIRRAMAAGRDPPRLEHEHGPSAASAGGSLWSCPLRARPSRRLRRVLADPLEDPGHERSSGRGSTSLNLNRRSGLGARGSHKPE